MHRSGWTWHPVGFVRQRGPCRCRSAPAAVGMDWQMGKGGGIEISWPDGRRLSIRGENTWHGLGDVVHYGTISFTTEAASNPLKLANSGCEVSATLVGDYLMLHDNDRCGGMNVRFQGAWKRALPQKRPRSDFTSNGLVTGTV